MSPAAPRHAVYGDLVAGETIALVAALAAKGLEFDFVGESPALSLALAARSGFDEGPYLRTPEGGVLGGLAGMLDYLERVHPEPAWRPTTPVRRIVSRILEDWIELWLPLWPERAGAVVEGLAVHLDQSPFLLGRQPCRADGSLAGWLEAEVFVDGDLRAQVERRAPRLIGFAATLRDAIHAGRGTRASRTLFSLPSRAGDEPAERVVMGEIVAEEPRERATWIETAPVSAALRDGRRDDDAIPFSLLALLREIALEHHAYLEANREAIAAGSDRVELELSDGWTTLPSLRHCEERRAALGVELAQLSAGERRGVRQMLEPLGVWRALVLPPATPAIALADPRAL